jgi:hypothetical protein
VLYWSASFRERVSCIHNWPLLIAQSAVFVLPEERWVSVQYGRHLKVLRVNLWSFVTSLVFCDEGLLAPRPTPKLEDHPLSALRDCLFNIFAVTFHIWRPFPPSATWGRAMPWWQGTHLICGCTVGGLSRRAQLCEWMMSEWELIRNSQSGERNVGTWRCGSVVSDVSCAFIQNVGPNLRRKVKLKFPCLINWPSRQKAIKVSGQLHALAAFPPKPIEWKSRCVQEL